MEEHLAPVGMDVETLDPVAPLSKTAGGFLNVSDLVGDVMDPLAPFLEEFDEKGVRGQRGDQLQTGPARQFELHPPETVANVVGSGRELAAQHLHHR